MLDLFLDLVGAKKKEKSFDERLEEMRNKNKEIKSTLENARKQSQSPPLRPTEVQATKKTYSNKELLELNEKERRKEFIAEKVRVDFGAILRKPQLVKKYDKLMFENKEYILGYIDNVLPSLKDNVELESSLELLMKIIKDKGVCSFKDTKELVNYAIYLRLKDQFKQFDLSNMDNIAKHYVNIYKNESSKEYFVKTFYEFLCINRGQAISFKKLNNRVLHYMNNQPKTTNELKKDEYIIQQSEIIAGFKNKLLGDKTQKMTIEQVDLLEGWEFEKFLGELFSIIGFKVELTKATGDQGADLILEKAGQRVVVQAKRYSSNVGNGAVQEVVAARAHYNCDKAWIVTNSYFTFSAVELARSNSVDLIDRDKLIDYLNMFL